MLTDFHSHILPDMDDGSRNVRESIDMLQMEADQGVRCVVATPHFYPKHDTPDRFLKRREKAAELLRKEMEIRGQYLEVKMGAEVLFFSGISNADQVFELTIDKKRCILIEMPMCQWTSRMYQELEEIYARHDIIPVIAHIDRYVGFLRTRGIMERLAQLPVLVQANASFFIRPATRGMALRMLRKEQIHVLGSDCHNMSDRKPNLQAAEKIVLQKLGTEALQKIQINEKKILGC